jgi:hypothetical protein
MTASAWTEHVKRFAAERGIRYGDALRHPECKAGYGRGALKRGDVSRDTASRGVSRGVSRHSIMRGRGNTAGSANQNAIWIAFSMLGACAAFVMFAWHEDAVRLAREARMPGRFNPREVLEVVRNGPQAGPNVRRALDWALARGVAPEVLAQNPQLMEQAARDLEAAAATGAPMPSMDEMEHWADGIWSEGTLSMQSESMQSESSDGDAEDGSNWSFSDDA